MIMRLIEMIYTDLQRHAHQRVAEARRIVELRILDPFPPIATRGSPSPHRCTC